MHRRCCSHLQVAADAQPLLAMVLLPSALALIISCTVAGMAPLRWLRECCQ